MGKITLKDVAARAGVHPSTASRALDPAKGSLVHADTVERVRTAARELGYQADAVASGLRRGRTNTLGIVVADLGNPDNAPLLRGIENHLEGRGLMPLIAESREDAERLQRALNNMAARRVDAVIVTGARSDDEHTLLRAHRQIPIVLAVQHLPGSGLPAVTHDDERGGRLAAEHLVEQGHLRIAQLCGPSSSSSFQERAAGFHEVLRFHDLETIEVPDTARQPTLEEGRRLMDLLLSQETEPPSAVFAHHDLMAIGALRSLDAQGLRCPDDVAVVGYDDAPSAALTDPALTTVRLPGSEIGRMAADMAVTLIEDRTHPMTSLSLPALLVTRRSTLTRSSGNPSGNPRSEGR